MKKITLILGLLSVLELLASGPIARKQDGTPNAHPTDQPLVWNLDAGDLSTAYGHDLIKELVRGEFEAWNAVPGSQLVIQEGEDVAFDITSLNQINQALAAGMNPIVLDEPDEMGNQTVFEDFGFGNAVGVLAFAGPTSSTSDPNAPLTGMFAVIGGTASVTQDRTAIRATLLHEFGHALGLGHSQVNGHLQNPRSNYLAGGEDYGIVGVRQIEIMYWQALRGINADLEVDDMAGFLALYGAVPTGTADLGGITGTIFLPDGLTPADGINVIARDISSGRDTVFDNASSNITCCGGSGRFSISGLPPGEYLIEVMDISNDSEDQANYSDPIRTNNENSGATVIGPLPGVREFYNGVNESFRPETDNPDEVTTVTVSAGSTVSDIEIVFNREPGLKGSLLRNAYYLPEIQTGDQIDTYVGVVNPGSVESGLQVFGFTADGEEVPATGVAATLSPLAKLWLSVKAMFPDDFARIAWVQVGVTEPLYVYAELQTPSTRSAYWASKGLTDQAVMPHVAKRTNLFETFIASLNGARDGSQTRLISKPTEEIATSIAHETGYNQSTQDLREFFGDNLNPVDWVSLESDGQDVAAMEFFTRLPDRTQTAALDLNNQRGSSLRFLHIATNTSLFWTGMVYINVSNQDVIATETYYDAAGAVLKTEEQPLAPGQKITLLFDANTQDRVPPGSSWMKVSLPPGGQGELVGYELFGSGSNAQDVFAGLGGNYTNAIGMDFPHFQAGDGLFTALVATNTGAETASLTLQAIGFDGAILEEAVVADIGPNQKSTELVRNLFVNPETLANAAWVRVNPSGSDWAGFMLWGDDVGVRQHLSGIAAGLRGESPIDNPRLIPETQSAHNTYETAMPIQAINGILDRNVLAHISQDGGAGPIVNTCCNDGIEDIYSFTLTEPKDLVIALAPSDPNADLDLFVVQGALPNQNFFGADPNFDPNIDYSGNAGGLENVTRRYAPGTYYILVTLFQGDSFQEIDYGLLVTEKPLALGTFESVEPIADWILDVNLASDSDGEPAWSLDSGFSEAKFGVALNLAAPPFGETESGILVTNFFKAPTNGTTIFDFDTGAITTGPINDQNDFIPLWFDSELTPTFASNSNIGLVSGAEGSPTPYGGGVVDFITWSSWVLATLSLNNPITEFMPTPDLLGQELAFGLLIEGRDVNWLVDNVRVFNVISSLNANKTQPRFLVNPRKPKGVSVPKLVHTQKGSLPVIKKKAPN